MREVRDHKKNFVRVREIVRLKVILVHFSSRKTAPLSESCQACAIIPGRKLFLHQASNPNINPKTAIRNMRAAPS